MLSPLLFNVFFATAIHFVLVRFGEGEDIVKDWLHFEEELVVRREVPLSWVRRAVWGTWYADDAGIVPTSAEAFA